MENAEKIGADGDLNPGPRGFVVFRAALVTARTDGKTLTWVGKEGIHSETVNFFKKNSETVNVCTRVRVVFLCFALKFWRVGRLKMYVALPHDFGQSGTWFRVRVALGLGFKGNKFTC